MKLRPFSFLSPRRAGELFFELARRASRRRGEAEGKIAVQQPEEDEAMCEAESRFRAAIERDVK